MWKFLTVYCSIPGAISSLYTVEHSLGYIFFLFSTYFFSSLGVCSSSGERVGKSTFAEASAQFTGQTQVYNVNARWIVEWNPLVRVNSDDNTILPRFRIKWWNWFNIAKPIIFFLLFALHFYCTSWFLFIFFRICFFLIWFW